MSIEATGESATIDERAHAKNALSETAPAPAATPPAEPPPAIARAIRSGANEEMLYRKPDATGIKTKLGDGREWIVPHIQMAARAEFKRNQETGEIQVDTRLPGAIEQGLSGLAELYLNNEIGQELTVSWGPIFLLMFEALRINYPGLTPEAATRLGLFNAQVAEGFLEALAGIKKKESPPIGSGQTSPSPATGASQT